MSTPDLDLDTWRSQAREWLTSHRPLRTETTGGDAASESVSVFHDLTREQEETLLRNARDWQRAKFEAGFGAIGMGTEFGGRGLPAPYVHVYAEEEARVETPPSTELIGVTVGLIAPTIAALGTPEQKERFVRPMLATDLLACQLFSEPSAGSDLAGLSTRAVRDGDEWVINGQKVWTSGAGFADFGELIARTDPDVPKHKGLTAFMLSMDTPGVTVRPIRQMSGGSSFYEVFLDDVRIPDTDRLGAEGEGWKVALTTLGFERGNAGHRQVGGSYDQLLRLATQQDRLEDPRARDQLVEAWVETLVLQLIGQRISAANARGEAPGAAGSVRKLLWSGNLTRFGEVASELLGSRMTVDTGEWGTFAWNEQFLGAPGFRIAGGSDEIQKNIIGERVLGLPAEPRVDKDLPFAQTRRG